MTTGGSEGSATEFKGPAGRWRLRLVILRRYLALSRQLVKQEGILPFLQRLAGRIIPATTSKAKPNPRYELETHESPLHFVVSDDPSLSVIVPIEHDPKALYTCLHSLHQAQNEADLEVIVVGDDLSDVNAATLSKHSGLIRVDFEDTPSFSSGCAIGAEHARAATLLFLSSDSKLLPGAISIMQALLKETESPTIVGPKCLSADGRLLVSSGVIGPETANQFGLALVPNHPEHSFRKTVDFLSTPCLMLTEASLLALGGFDARHASGAAAATALTARCSQLGGKVIYQPASAMVWFCDEAPMRDMARIARDALSEMPKPASASVRRSVRLKVLVVDAYVCSPNKDAGSLRMWEVLNLLVDQGCAVTFLPMDLKATEPYTGRLQARGIEVVYAPFESSAKTYLEKTAGRFQLVILSRFTVANRLLDSLSGLEHRPHIVFDTVDLHFLREQRYAELSGNSSDKNHAELTRALELRLINKADTTFVVSGYEKALLEDKAPAATVQVVSDIQEVVDQPASHAQRRDSLFIGGFRHPPNLDAVEFLARDVMPLISERMPEMKVHVIGANMPATIKRLETDNLIMHGFVDDLAPFFQGCLVSLAPLRFGAGVKGKITRSLGQGLPVIATSLAVEGMHLEHRVNCLVADTPEAFAECLSIVQDDGKLWQRIAENGRDTIDRHFSREAARASLESMIQRVEGGR